MDLPEDDGKTESRNRKDQMQTDIYAGNADIGTKEVEDVITSSLLEKNVDVRQKNAMCTKKHDWRNRKMEFELGLDIGFIVGFIVCAAVLVREEKNWLRRIYKKAYQDARKDIEEENDRERFNYTRSSGRE